MRYDSVVESLYFVDFPNHDAPEHSVSNDRMCHSDYLLLVVLQVLMHHIDDCRPVSECLLEDLVVIKIADPVTIEKV